jgi:hypothetical protein
MLHTAVCTSSGSSLHRTELTKRHWPHSSNEWSNEWCYLDTQGTCIATHTAWIASIESIHSYLICYKFWYKTNIDRSFMSPGTMQRPKTVACAKHGQYEYETTPPLCELLVPYILDLLTCFLATFIAMSHMLHVCYRVISPRKFIKWY